MKREGRPTQRLEEKRVEEHVGEGGRESERGRERERAHTHRRERERESALAPPFMFFPPPGPALCKFGLAKSAVFST